MKKQALFVAILLTGVSAVDSAAQAWFFPDVAYPASTEAPETWVSGTLSRGLNDASGEPTAIGIGAARVWKRFVLSGSVGYLTEGGTELTTAIHGAVNANKGSAQVALQVGVGRITFDGLDGVASVRFPVGVVVKTVVQRRDLAISPWIMPRVTLTSVRPGTSTTYPGISGGVWITGAKGFGIHAAVDALFRDFDSLWLVGIGLQWNGRALREVFR